LKELVITDGTANIGGSVINFALECASVNAVEIDSDTVEVLTHNVRTYDLGNVNIIHGDYLSVLGELKQDIVFLDPPWGGVDYARRDKIMLYLSRKPIGLVINSLIGKVKVVALKVPKNFDFTTFFNHNAFPICHIHRVYNYYLIICSSSK
jgi:predicted RNA methylase